MMLMLVLLLLQLLTNANHLNNTNNNDLQNNQRRKRRRRRRRFNVFLRKFQIYQILLTLHINFGQHLNTRVLININNFFYIFYCTCTSTFKYFIHTFRIIINNIIRTIVQRIDISNLPWGFLHVFFPLLIVINKLYGIADNYLIIYEHKARAIKFSYSRMYSFFFRILFVSLCLIARDKLRAA